jgi:hypothetical protein
MGDAHMSSPPSTTPQGTEFVHTKKNSKLSKQLANAEKIAATATSLAIELQNPVKEAEHSPVLAHPAQATMEVPPGTSGMSTPARGRMDPQEESTLRTQLFSDFATLRQDRQDKAAPCSQLSLPTDVTPSFSTADSLSAISSTSNLGGRHVGLLALNASTYSSFPHGSLPANKDTKGGDDKDMFSMAHRTTPGAAGHFWFLLAGFEFIEGADSHTTMLAGMSALIEIFSGIITDFQVIPIDPKSTLLVLTSNWPEEDLPQTAAMMFRYLHVKNKTNNRGASQSQHATQTVSLHQHSDKEEYKPPTGVWGNLRVKAGENIREMCESKAWDMSGTGIRVQWKEHQLADSSSRILIMCVPNVFNKDRLKEELLFHMKAVERKMVTKGKLPTSLLTEPIPLITLAF